MGFTIVELLIVIVVIAILAGIVIIAYNGVIRSTSESSMKALLQTVAQRMEVEKIDSGTTAYPTTFPADIIPPKHIGIAFAAVDHANEYCVNATHQNYDDMLWHVTQEGVVTQGLCSGALLAETIVGDYNMGNESLPLASAVTTVQGDGGGFTLKTDETWETFTLSWDAVAGASRYEIQTRSGASGTWYLRSLATGSSNYNITASSQANPSYSAQIPGDTTSVSWTSSSIKPINATTAHEYRLRSYDASNTASEWNTISFTPPANSELTQVTNFTVTPTNNWNAIQLSWDDVSHNNVPSPTIEIQSRVNSASSWHLSMLGAGNSGYNSGSATLLSDPAYSAQIPVSTTSLEWTSSSVRPASSTATHEYRARLRSNIMSGMASDWVTTTLSPPSSSDLDKLSNFKVTPSNDWTTINFSWDLADTTALPNPSIELQTRSSAAGTWYLRSIATGSSNYNSGLESTIQNPDYSAQIPISTTSLDWTSSAIKPNTISAVHEYRVRIRANNIAGVAGPWQTATLSPTIPAPITGFSVTPNNDWTSIRLQWNPYTPVSTPTPTIEIQSRVSASGTWNIHDAATGSGRYNSSSDSVYLNPDYSAQIPIGTPYKDWTSSTVIPPADKTYDYRIRVRGNAGISGVVSPWTEASLTH